MPMMDVLLENGEVCMQQIQTKFTSLCKETALTNTGSAETRDLITHLQEIISDNLDILSDLKSQRKKMIEDHIKMQCDKEQLELELSTVAEQLNLHVKHSGTDQNMLVQMM
eukprot:806197_1